MLRIVFYPSFLKREGAHAYPWLLLWNIPFQNTFPGIFLSFFFSIHAKKAMVLVVVFDEIHLYRCAL